MLEQDTQEAVGEELFNLAAIRTMQNGGDIVVQENGEDKSAAICRW